jgi:abortive infection bacteriophage resistance protein
LSLLVANGLEVSDPDLFLNFLKQQNYYRLRGYFHPFLAETDGKVTSKFKPQSTAQTIIELVEFDRMLRSLLFEALAVFETQFRSVLTYHAGEASPHAHVNGIGLAAGYKTVRKKATESDHEKWLIGYRESLRRHKDNDIVVKHNTFRDGKFPIWAAVELLDFGKISRLFGGLNEPIATAIAAEFGGGVKFIKGAVQSLNDLRNHVAHQSRLWNFHYLHNPPASQSKLPSELLHLHRLEDHEQHKLFTRLSLLLWLDRENRFGLNLRKRLFDLLQTLPKSEYIKLSSMGYSSAFQSSNLWSGFSH